MDLALVQALEQSGEPHLKGAFQEYPDCGDEICFDTVGQNSLDNNIQNRRNVSRVS